MRAYIRRPDGRLMRSSENRVIFLEVADPPPRWLMIPDHGGERTLELVEQHGDYAVYM